MSPKTNRYCQKLAEECDLQQLDQVAEWLLVGKRPKDFVKRLLVLDEEQRLTASDAKKHRWFSNDFHRVDFEELYYRATKHWKPRTLRTLVIEVLDEDFLREQPVLQKNDLEQRNVRKRGSAPADPPYKPYPHRMSLSLLPRRRARLSGIMSDEVRMAIRENWSPEKMRVQAPGADEKVAALIPDTGSNELDRLEGGKGPQRAPKKTAIHRPRASFTSPFRPLIPKQLSVIPNGACSVAEVTEGATQAVRRASCSSISSTETITVKKPRRFDQAKSSQAEMTILGGSEGTPPAVESTIDGNRIHHGGGDSPRQTGKVVLNQGKEDVAAEKLDLLVKRPTDQGNRIVREPFMEVKGCQQDSLMLTCSLPRYPRLKAAIDARSHAQADLPIFQPRDTPSKLRLPLRKRLTVEPGWPSRMKKRRRGSIFDLEPDEASERAPYGLSRLTTDSDSTVFRPNTACKKART